MSDGFDELYELADDLTGAGPEVNKRVKQALQFTSMEIKQDWREGAAFSDYFPESYAAAIDFTLSFPGDAIVSDIGPTLGRTGGASAGFLEEGGGGVDGPPTHAGRDALEANEEDFYRGLEIAMYDATKKAVDG